jgi:hypothetical protein
LKLRFLVRLLSKESREHTSAVSLVKSLAHSLGIEARNAKRTSYGALEFDIFANSETDFELFTSALRPLFEFEFIHDLNQAPKHMTRKEIIREARSYFNSERFWECHEALESLWRVSKGDERNFLQGVILIATAFVHWQKQEDATAFRVLERASHQLTWVSDNYDGVDLGTLRKSVETILTGREFVLFKI